MMQFSHSTSIIDNLEVHISTNARMRGLLVASDEVSQSASALGGMLSIDADTIEGLRAEQGWNDQPVIERLLTAVLKSAQKVKAKPETRRMLVLLPDMRVVAVIALSFSGIADPLDVMKTGTWSLSFTVKGGSPSNGQGELVKHGSELSDMLGRLIAVFDGLHKDHNLSVPQNSDGIDWSKVPGPHGAVHVGGFGPE